ncbi:MAG TPA: hypothetical protein VG456_04520 [Candidatus Sulfopaludibacter sp.]|jgi:photosystem II stability/assembly factor-like uncharacterized protein|nr:hypothetical protein [Candidatus Sulfopaludibacter sp.]
MRGIIRLAPVSLALALVAAAQSVSPVLLNGLQWRSIGPAATGGRIADIAVGKHPGEPLSIYVATTSGGIFKSGNEGVSWSPVFDHAGGMMSMGAIAVSASNPSIVWAGTGEADNRQSSSWGDGVYQSVDAGVTWKKMGLEDSRHIGRIVIHPTDPNTVYVAAAGHLWGPNSERGVYKTSDGGKTWSRVLYKDENTGAIDLAMDPSDPNTVYAALYQRQRKGWGFNGGGPGSGLYRTTDGGAHWTELHGGLPQAEKGRIGLCIFPGDPRIVYAIVEADPQGAGGRGGRGAAAMGAVTQAGGIFRTTNKGDTWEHMSGVNPRPSYYSRIYVDPKDSGRVYIMGSNRGFFVSNDSGKSFREVFSSVHGEDHTLWVNPENTNQLVIGGDGGISISYDRGLTWLFRLNLPIGQFYNIAVNNQQPYLVCGGLQDNGNWCTPSASRISYGVSFKDAFNIGGGDGMQAVFEGDDHTVLTSSQNGYTARLDLENMESQNVGPVPPAERGKPPYRWYWTTPLIVSSFNPDVIYTGANMLFRSPDRGVTWQTISGDLTADVDRDKLSMMGGPVPSNALSRHDGQSNFSALTVVAESPLDRNLLYTGADDGSLHVTRDGGAHWTALSVRGLPPMLNISGIAPSKFAAGRVYLTVDGHFNDDYHPYVFVSEDYGRSWKPIAEGLPQTSVHRLREYPSNANLLVAGTEMGAYVSLDRGAHWLVLGGELPPVPVYDLVFQERDHALVLGTHGRSIWLLDDAAALAELTPQVLSSGGIFTVPPVHHENIFGGQFWFGAGEFFAPNPPMGAVLDYYLPQPAASVAITVADSSGNTIRTLHGSGAAGMNRVCWDLKQAPALSTGPTASSCTGTGGGGRGGGSGPLVLPGKYVATVTPQGGASMAREVTVVADPHFKISEADRVAHHAAVMSAYAAQEQLGAGRNAAQALFEQIPPMRLYLTSMGDKGKSLSETLEKVSTELTRVQGEISRTVQSASRLESAMDSYPGLPTAAQSRELDWAWEDAATAVNTFNRLLTEMSAIYTSMGDAVPWRPIPAVTVPVRTR